MKMGGLLDVSCCSRLRSQVGAAMQIGGVLPYKLDVYCSAFQTHCTANPCPSKEQLRCYIHCARTSRAPGCGVAVWATTLPRGTYDFSS